MSEQQMLYCLIAFILGWMVSKHMGNGFRVGCGSIGNNYYKINDFIDSVEQSRDDLIDSANQTMDCL